jgi:hypothetical protein
MDPSIRWTLPYVIFLLDVASFVSAVHIPFHASRVQHVQINKYLLIKNCNNNQFTHGSKKFTSIFLLSQ